MASLKVGLFLFVLFHAIFFFPATVMGCGTGAGGRVFDGINVYRTFVNLPAFTMNLRATCFANEFAGKLRDQPCNGTLGVGANNKVKLDNYPRELSKCGIDANHTTDSVVMPVCVPKSGTTQVLTNYTGTQYKKYINDSRYIEVGIGSKRDWTVVILSTNTSRGDFKGATSSVSKVGISHCLMSLLLGMLFCLVH